MNKPIKPGDTITRMLAGVIPMDLNVTEITEDRIVCGPWAFDRKTGWEIDEELDHPASYILIEKETCNHE